MVNPVSTPRIVTDGDLAANAASYARHLRAAKSDARHPARLP